MKFLITALLLISCSKNPVPPVVPPPVVPPVPPVVEPAKEFLINSANLKIEGKLKEGAKVDAAQAKSAIAAAAEVLESK